MRNRKLFQLLSTFSTEEYRAAVKYVTHHHPRKPQYARALRELRRFHPRFDADRLTESYLFSRLYPGKPFDAKVLADLFSGLKAALDDFLIARHMEEDPIDREWLLLRIYSKRGLGLLFRQSWNRLGTFLDQRPSFGVYLFQAYLYFWVYFSSRLGEKVGGRELLFKASRLLFQAFFSGQLRVLTELRSRKAILNEQRESALYKFLARILDEDPGPEEPLLHLQYLTWKFTEKADTDSYHRLKEAYFEHFQLLNPAEQREILGYLLNFLARKIPEGERWTVEESFQLYDFAHRKEILAHPEILSHTAFINAVNIAAHLGKLEWLDSFIRKWGPSLPPAHRLPAVQLAEAYRMYASKQYEAAYERLVNMLHPDIFYSIWARTLLLRCLYEMGQGNEELLFNQAAAYRHFLNRKRERLSRHNYESHLNFIRAVLALSERKKSPEALLKEIQAMQYCTSRNWLLEKVESYEAVAR